MAETRTPPGELAERLVDRLCHDIASCTQALASGMDLLAEATSDAAREEAIAFLTDALAMQSAKTGFARRAFGSAATSTETSVLKRLAEDLFADLRPTLDWAVEAPSLGPVASRALLNLMQISAETLAFGGCARVQARRGPNGTLLTVEASGARIMLRDATRAGLAGDPLGGGLSGPWVQGAFVSDLVASAGGRLSVEPVDGTVVFQLSLPPEA